MTTLDSARVVGVARSCRRPLLLLRAIFSVMRERGDRRAFEGAAFVTIVYSYEKTWGSH